MCCRRSFFGGALALLSAARVGNAHGTLNLPESRNGAQAGLGLGQGGRTQPYSVAYWYTDETRHTGNATIADDACALLTCYQCAQQAQQGGTGGCASSRQARTPWRAPGTAPLRGGPCGTIGWDGAVGRNASITAGTDLPSTSPAAVWRIGAAEKVAWGLAVNHGGGYMYRLCPAGEALTEACFQRTPLAFVGNTSDIVGPHGETLYTIPATRTAVGTTPAGSQWTRNPVPTRRAPARRTSRRPCRGWRATAAMPAARTAVATKRSATCGASWTACACRATCRRAPTCSAGGGIARNCLRSGATAQTCSCERERAGARRVGNPVRHTTRIRD
jgi:hypothetical protein